MMFDSQNSAQQNKKTFVFQNQLTSQSTISYHKINTQKPFTDLKPILDLHCPIQKNRIQLFNTFLSKFTALEKINPQNPTLIPNQFLEYGFIMLRYKNIKSHENQSFDQESISESSQLSNNKKDRSKQRTIGSVIELVKKWRRLHMANDAKKLNLQQAAKLVGVSKKSLDDYYYQLRIGEQNQFDFQQNLNEKIGVLRTFVKSKKPEKIQKHRNSKHPKILRIIEEHLLNDEAQEDLQQKREKNQIPSLQNSLLRNIQNQNDPFFSESASLMIGKDLQAIENNYFENFQNFFDPDEDPYFYTGDFKKKGSLHFGSDSDILF